MGLDGVLCQDTHTGIPSSMGHVVGFKAPTLLPLKCGPGFILLEDTTKDILSSVGLYAILQEETPIQTPLPVRCTYTM